jgi:hypothetical protein
VDIFVASNAIEFTRTHDSRAICCITDDVLALRIPKLVSGRAHMDWRCGICGYVSPMHPDENYSPEPADDWFLDGWRFQPTCVPSGSQSALEWHVLEGIRYSYQRHSSTFAANAYRRVMQVANSRSRDRTWQLVLILDLAH